MRSGLKSDGICSSLRRPALQVSVACLDVGRFKEASDLINALNKQFPDSVRARRLQGMYFEALGRWDEAATVYKELLQAGRRDLP